MLAGILHVTILTIVCLLVFLEMLPVLFATGFCERVTHFLDIRFAGGSSSTSKDLFLDAVNTISSGVSGEGSEVMQKRGNSELVLQLNHQVKDWRSQTLS